MIFPDEMGRYADLIVELFRGIEEMILQDIARKIAKAAEMGAAGSLDFNVSALMDSGMSLRDIQREIAVLSSQNMEEVASLFERANINSFNRERQLYAVSGLNLQMTFAKQQILLQSIRTVGDHILSMTGSLGMLGQPLSVAYQNILNTAFLQVQSGAVSYNVAIRQSIRALSDMGLQRVVWQTGHVDNLDVAIRRAVLTSLQQVSNRISEINADEMGCNGWETSAHSGARPTHKDWQGRQFARFPHDTQGFPLFDAVVGGMMEDFNCRHSKWGIFLGIDAPALTQEELDSIDPPDFEFNGRIFNAYEATQMQRKIEREIRRTKREFYMFAEAGSLGDMVHAEDRLKDLNGLYRIFSRTAGLPLQRDRTRI